MNLNLFRSRKFWAAVAGVGIIALKAYVPQFPVSDEQLTQVVYLLVAFVGGVALEDGLKARR